MFCMASSPGIDAETDLENAGQMILSNGLVYQWLSVFNPQVSETDGELWCPCRQPPILSNEEGPRQGI